MKGKKQLYILLPAVAIIWGIIIYRIVDAISIGPAYTPRQVVLKSGAGISLDSVSYELSLDYRDPFYTINNKSRRKSTNNSKNQKAQKKTNNNKPKAKAQSKVNWNYVRYYGIVENPQTKQKTALLSIRGKYHYMKKGDEVDEFLLSTVYKDSVGVRALGELMYIKK